MSRTKNDIIKSNNLLINQSEMLLLQHSKTIGDTNLCGNLQDAIFDKCSLTYKEVEESIELDTKAKTLLLHNKRILMNSVNNEWTPLPTKDVALPGTLCSLCHKKLKTNYYIRNIFTEEIINIGSDCINGFSEIVNREKLMKEIEANNKIKLEQERKVAFEELEYKNNLINFHNEAFTKFRNLEIILPFELEIKIQKVLKLIQFYKNNYIINNGDIDCIFVKYLEAIKKYENLMIQALDIIQQNKSKKLICHKIEADWLLNNNIDIRNEIASKDGFYTTSTLKYVFNDHFISEHITEFNKKVKNLTLRIINVKNGFIKFTYQHSKSIHPITFHITSKFFMYNIGCYCLTVDDFRYGINNIKDIKIETSVNNFYSLLNIMKNSMNAVYLDIEIYNDVDLFYLKKLSQEQISRIRTRATRSEVGYKRITYQSFTEFCNNILFSTDEEIIDKFRSLHRLYTNKNEWISKKQKDIEINIIKSAPTYSKQKEFI